jgi:hypothetical protein
MNNHLLVNKLDNLTLDKLKNTCDAPVVLKLVKEIIKSKDAVDSNGSINVIVFAEYYAFALSKLVNNEETSDDYDDVYDTHRDWGYSIAEALNQVLMKSYY